MATHRPTIQRRSSLPQELEDLDDLTGVDAASVFDAMSRRPQQDELNVPKGPLTPQTSPSSSTTNSGTATPSTTLAATLLHALPKEIRHMMAGGLAGMVAKSFVAPLDRIKIMYQVSSVPFELRKLPHVVRTLIQQEGTWRALWKGNTATMIRVVPYSGIQFMVFEKAKSFFLLQQQQRQFSNDHSSVTKDAATPPSKRSIKGLTPLESLVSGMLAGTISVICTYPLDLARAQLAVTQARQASIRSVLLSNYHNRGLFRGLSITLMGMLPYAGIAFALNEQTKRKIQEIQGRDITTLERIQSGALAGLVAQTLTYPVEVTRRRMQTLGLVGSVVSPASGTATMPTPTTTTPHTIHETVRNLYREQGARGFFKGVSMNWMKGPVAFAISFTTFDLVKGLMEAETERL